MTIEGSFSDFREIQEKISDEGGESSEGDEGFFAALDIVKENPFDPHLNVDVNKLTPADLAIALKFQKGELTEQELSDQLEHLSDGSPSSNFLAALRNKLVTKEGWRVRNERKLKESQQNDTV